MWSSEEWEHLRGSPQQALEAQDLINKLMISPESAEFPLAAHGLGSSPALELGPSVTVTSF
jgi:hypothetical protein